MNRRIQLKISDVVIVNFPERNPPGHEPTGIRPAIVVGVPCRIPQRYPMIEVVPTSNLVCTSTNERRFWADSFPEIYPILPKGSGNLRNDSIVLASDMQSVDRNRVCSYCGRLTLRQFLPVAKAIEVVYGIQIGLPVDV
jgi:mRNA interferase MazF